MITSVATDRFISGIFSFILPSSLVWKVDTKEKELYLTFDDGPVPGLTGEILEILDQYQAKATFFCVGDNVRKYPEIYREIRKRGHATGNHTQHHLKGIMSGFEQYLQDIREANRYVDSKLFRPPYGLMTPRQARALSREFKVVMWSVLTRDFDPDVTPGECLSRAIDGVFPGSIIVFHDNLKAGDKVLYALPRLLEYATKEGYDCRVLNFEF
jgi:peptidoglycan/xylan/chitin deacetylase (PgdA/CDA1 family)